MKKDTADRFAYRTSPPNRGGDFERRIGDLLKSLRSKYTNMVELEYQPRVDLQNQEKLVPDFDLIVSLPHERSHYFIECQDRAAYDKSLLHKISHIRAKQWRKTFLFIHADAIPSELARALGEEGVIHFTFDAFNSWLLNLAVVLEAITQFQLEHADYQKTEEDRA